MNIVEEKYDWAYALTPRRTTTLLVLHHEAASGSTAQQIHNYHKNANGWAGIAYHYYIRKDGTIYRGRPENMQGGHCLNYNYCSIGICFEGNFETETMGQAQINAGWELIADILRRYPGITVRRHKDLNATACPGRNFPFGILTGETNPTKKENDTEDIDMTKAELINIINQTIDDRSKAAAQADTYPEAEKAMSAAKDAGIITGGRPCSPVTRGELAITLSRLGLFK